MSNSKNIVSIIIPVYNVEKFLDKCIRSILNQTYRKLEIIIIDDGSTDKSGDIADFYREQDSRIKVYHKKNNGVSSARNFGIKKSRGSYIVFVDADDWIEPEYIDKMVECISRNDLCMCSFYYKGKKAKIKNNIIEKTKLFECLFKKSPFGGSPYGAVWGKMFKTKIIKNGKVRFREEMSAAEDKMFIIDYLAREEVKNIHILSDHLYHYTFRKNSATQKSDFYASDILEFEVLDDYSEKEEDEKLKRIIRLDLFFRSCALFWKYKEKQIATYSSINRMRQILRGGRGKKYFIIMFLSYIVSRLTKKPRRM